MLIGYARVFSQDQNLEMQRNALTLAGCEQIFEDTNSGTRADRPGLKLAMEALQDGDTLVIWKLDRLGRSVKGLIGLVGELAAGGIQFSSLADSINTNTMSGRVFFQLMASLAEMERELMIERTKAGLAAAKQQGRTGGQKRLMTDIKIDAAKKLLAGGATSKSVARDLEVSVATLYRWVPAS